MRILQKPEFRFDPVRHEYWLGSKRLPGVSEILKTVGLSKDFANVDPFYRDRGIIGHRCIELFLKGELDESSVDPCLEGHFEGFKRFWGEHDLKPLFIETARYNASYAGTIDLVTEEDIWDWKFSKSHDKVAELQGEAYKILEGNLCHKEDIGKNFKVVQFPGDGSYEITDYGYKVRNWPSVMDLYRWKKGMK